MPPHRTLAILVAVGAVAVGAASAHAQELGPIAEAMFDRVDVNRDGVVTRDEMAANRATMFDRIDMNADGVLATDEIQAARDQVKARGARRLARLAEHRAEMGTPGERIAALDQDHDGVVSREEFVSGANGRFERLDADGRGVTKQDFAAFLDSAG